MFLFCITFWKVVNVAPASVVAVPIAKKRSSEEEGSSMVDVLPVAVASAPKKSKKVCGVFE